MNMTPGSLTVLDGEADAVRELMRRLAHVNDQRHVLAPAPWTICRDEVTDSAAKVCAALDRDYPVVVSGGQPPYAIEAGEPVPDLAVTVVTTSGDVAPPELKGSIRRGFRVTISGRHISHHLLYLFEAWLQASLAGLPVRQ